MLNWPSLTFPPINLNTAPRYILPCVYIELEREYCKGVAIELLTKKRKEFNKLWNERSKNG